MESSLFSRGTAVEALGDGRYSAQLGDHWNCPVVPQGGIVAATAARAMESALAEPTQSLRSLNGVFAGQVRDGAVEIEVTVLRRGRSVSQVRVEMRNPGAVAGFDALAVFGAERQGFAFTDARLPDGVRPPLECPSYREIDPDQPVDDAPFPFWNHVEGRMVIGHKRWQEYVPTTSLRAQYYRFDDPPRRDDGTWDPHALVALCDTMPGAVGERLGPSEGRQWLPPSADFTVHVLGEARADWVLGVNRARHAGDGYASIDMELWDLDGPSPSLVAYATQTMIFSFPK